MTREELDALWFQAMRQSIEAGEDFIRYHFAALVADATRGDYFEGWGEGYKAGVIAEREACAKVCEETRFPDSYTAIRCAAAIRARGET